MGAEIGTLRGILLLAHGGPSSLEDVPAFLGRVRGGRPCSEQLADEVRERYRFMGGFTVTVYHPRAAAKLEQAAGFRCTSVCCIGTPCWRMSSPRWCGTGFEGRGSASCLISARVALGGTVAGLQRPQGRGLAFDFVDSWYVSPPFIEGLAYFDSRLAGGARESARSPIPRDLLGSQPSQSRLPSGDPYELQLRETADRVAGGLR